MVSRGGRRSRTLACATEPRADEANWLPLKEGTSSHVRSGGRVCCVRSGGSSPTELAKKEVGSAR